ncbi:MAG TPA: YceI family protein [Chloroflexota bacterium]|nr:YceI family protein [Chloroflexota bacterium]
MPWQYDGNLSKVEWSVRYLGIATVKGWFRDVQVSLDLDPESPLDWKTSITIAAASVYTGYEQLDDHLRHADFLDAERYPTIGFESRKVEALPNGNAAVSGQKYPGVVAWEPRCERYRITGDVTLHGVTRPAELDAWYFGQATDGRGRTRRAFSATTMVRRSDFNIYVPPQVDPARIVAGEEVTLQIEAITTKMET